MPNNLRNWVFEDIEDFLKNHYFEIIDHNGSHYYFLGNVGGEQRLLEIQYHSKESIHPKTLRYYVIVKSGIPEEYWLEYARAGKKSVKKNIVYEKAKPIPEEWKTKESGLGAIPN